MSAVVGWPPRFLTPTTAAERKRGDGAKAAAFIEALCRVDKQSFAAPAGDLIRLLPWQKQLLQALLARRVDGRLKHRTALIGMPRKSGKSALLSGLTMRQLVMGDPGSEIYAVAATRDQARIVFETAKSMIRLEPELAGACKIYRDVIENTVTRSIYKVLASEAPQLEGLSPSFVAFDELHAQPNRELFDVLSLASAARIDPMLVAITTAGVKTDATGRDSLCYSMFQYLQRVANGEAVDDTFFGAWWQPKFEGADYKDPKVWKQANPGFGVLSDPEDFESALKRTLENEFKTKRLNIWTSAQQAWLPDGTWKACASDRKIEEGTEVVIGFDGSFSNDSTAVIAVTTDEPHHIMTLGLWERPSNRNEEWQVPIAEVEQCILDACRLFDVREIACDPYRWARTMEALDVVVPGKVVEFPQSPQRMSPATMRFYQMVVDGQVTHDNHPGLGRHVGNAVVKQDARGSRIVKESRFSNKKIDAAVATIIALDRACWQPPVAEFAEVGFFNV